MRKQVKERKAEQDFIPLHHVVKQLAPLATVTAVVQGPQLLTHILEYPKSSKNQRLKNNLAATPNMN